MSWVKINGRIYLHVNDMYGRMYFTPTEVKEAIKRREAARRLDAKVVNADAPTRRSIMFS
jgi:hypothetical protein